MFWSQRWSSFCVTWVTSSFGRAGTHAVREHTVAVARPVGPVGSGTFGAMTDLRSRRSVLRSVPDAFGRGRERLGGVFQHRYPTVAVTGMTGVGKSGWSTTSAAGHARAACPRPARP